jgi:hypothetical protein
LDHESDCDATRENVSLRVTGRSRMSWTAIIRTWQWGNGIHGDQTSCESCEPC